MIDWQTAREIWSQDRPLWVSLVALGALLLGLMVLSIGAAVTRQAWLPLLLVVTSLLCYVFVAAACWQGHHRSQVRAEGRNRHQQAAILKLLDEMGPLADGDLSAHATVDESMTGALADAFNHAVSELHWLVGEAVGSAQTVRQAVAAAQSPMSALVNGASVQSREVLRSSNYLGAMSSAMTELALNAGESARRSRVSHEAMAAYRGALNAAHQEFENIRAESLLTTRLTQRLAENLSAIDAQSSLVRGMATRTDLLALNTTVRAANNQAGAMPIADYARVSDDVAELARALEQASFTIAELTTGIREDADEVLRAMSQTDAALATAVSELDALHEGVDTVASRAAELQSMIGETAENATRQARVLSRVSNNMTVIDRISRDGARGVSRIADELSTLQTLADELESSVSRFRLPKPPTATAQRRRVRTEAET